MDHNHLSYSPLIKILNWNADGLHSKRSTFINFLNHHNISVACISETHLTTDQVFKIPGYKIYRFDRIVAAKASGGAAIIIKSSIDHEPIILPSMQSLEVVGVKIKLINNNLFQLFACYLQPKRSISILDLNTIFSSNLPTILAGDLNSKHPCWYSRVSNPNGRKLFKIMNKCDWMVIGPDEPTYFPTHENRHPDVLDILVCKNISGIISQDVIVELDSDHVPVIIEMDAISLSSSCDLRLPSNKVDWELFQHNLSEEISIPSRFNSSDDIDCAVLNFTRQIKNCVRHAIHPNKIHSVAKFSSLTQLPFHLNSLIKYKHKVRRNWQAYRLRKDKKLLNIITRKLKFQLDQHRYEGYQEYLENLHPEDCSLYKETKRILKQHETIPSLKMDSNIYLTATEDKCNAFANHLEETFKCNLDDIPSEHIDQVNEFVESEFSSVQLPIEYCTPQEIDDIIRHLKNKKAPGFDLITNSILKNLPRKAIVYLCAIINACMYHSHFPISWKHAQIIMIKKAGKNKENVESYRPISLLPTMSKILEKVLLRRLKTVLAGWNVLPDGQFGFRENHSTTHQLLRFSEFVNRSFENKKIVTAAFLDLQQAFDKVWHSGLIYKMRKLDFPIYLVDVLSSFLEDRSFAVKINGYFSEIKKVHASVPQGSVLGPVLYSIYASDILSSNSDDSCDDNSETSSDNDDSSIFEGLFADDIALATSSDSIEDACKHLQMKVDIVNNWCNLWGIRLNPVKSESKIFTLRRVGQMPPCITVRGEQMFWKKESVKWLGVWHDKRLNWADHIHKKVGQGYQRLSLLYPVLNKKSRLNMKSALLIYKAILRPIVTYAAPVWICAANSHLKRLEVFESKILRIITKAPWFVRNMNIRKDLKIPSIKEFITKLTIDLLEMEPHGLGKRGWRRRMNPHLPQDVANVVTGLNNL